MRFAIIAAGALAGSAVVLSGNTARADATPTGVEVGLRTGYAAPFGGIGSLSAAGFTLPGQDLNSAISGMVPIWVDAGYRFTPNMMIGAFFQYGIGFVSTSSQLTQPCSASGVSCSASNLMFGLQFHYHFLPDQPVFDPWAGIGVGYEIMSLSESGNGGSASYGASGFQFVNVQGGGDFKVMPNLGVGPFVSFSLGQYSGCSVSGNGQSPSCSIPSSSMHEWLTFGIRGAYDINL
jgi:hypothetical protein